MHLLTGNKTYLCALAAGVVQVAHSLGWIDDAVYQTIFGLLSAGGLAALRAGVTKSGPTG